MSKERIKALRERLRLSQRAFAEMVGVDTQTVSRWERGTMEPRRLALRMLSQIEREMPPDDQPAPPPEGSDAP